MAFTKEDSLGKVKAIIAEKLKIPQDSIKPELTFKDLGADSLDIVEMIMSFEEEFGIEIRDEDAEKIKTVNEAVEHMHSARTK